MRHSKTVISDRKKMQDEKENNERIKKIGDKKKSKFYYIYNTLGIYLGVILILFILLLISIFISSPVQNSLDKIPKEISKIDVYMSVEPIQKKSFNNTLFEKLNKTKFNSKISFGINENNSILKIIDNKIFIYDKSKKIFINSDKIINSNSNNEFFKNILPENLNDFDKFKILNNIEKDKVSGFYEGYSNIVNSKNNIFINNIDYIFDISTFSKILYFIKSNSNISKIYIFDKNTKEYNGNIEYLLNTDENEAESYLENNIFPSTIYKVNELESKAKLYLSKNKVNKSIIYYLYSASYDKEKNYFNILKIYLDKKKNNKINNQVINILSVKSGNILIKNNEYFEKTKRRLNK